MTKQKTLSMSDTRKPGGISDKERIKRLKKKLARAESDNESMQRYVATARKANQKKWIKKRKTKTLKDDWVRLLVPDLHGSSMDPEVVPVMLNDLDRIEVDEIVLGGDILECGGFLAQHFTLGFVAQTEYTYENDIAATNQFLDTLLEKCPKVQAVHYLEGNHEQRVEKWAVTQALRNGRDAQFLLDQIGPRKVLDLERRGVKYYSQAECYDGVSIPGTVRLGQCYFTHGISACKHAAALHAERLGGNVVYFHKHKLDAWETHTVSAGQIGAWCPGCLCLKQRMWHHTRPSTWTSGYGLQIVSRSGLFQPLNIRIIDGQSMLAQFTRSVK